MIGFLQNEYYVRYGIVATTTDHDYQPPLSRLGDAVRAKFSRLPLMGKRTKSSKNKNNNAINNMLIKANTPSNRNALIFAGLRESIQALEGGYVHPDLGILMPAPSGAVRGIGMTKDSYSKCVDSCNVKDDPHSSVLMKIPLAAQMTREVAIKTLSALIPADVQRKVPLQDLDDAALLVLLLAHEKGKGPESRFLAYIVSLPSEPSCGYSSAMRGKAMDTVALLRDRFGADVNGWPAEITKAAEYAERISASLARDYGNYIKIPQGWNAYNAIQWSLCQVASRATGGSRIYGSLRLVPLLDMINHNVDAGGFVELLGHERVDEEDGSFYNATETDAGAFVVRNMKKGRPVKLKKGDEILANYNVPDYSPLDWFLNLGFIPPERRIKWTMVDSALPKMKRRGGHS